MRTISIVLGLALFATPASANHIGLYSTPVPYSCLSLAGPGPLSIYVVHHGSTGSKGVSFRVDASLPGGMDPIGASPIGFVCVGDCDPYLGVSVGRPTCSTDDWPVFRLDFLMLASDVPRGSCYHLQVVGFPGDEVLSVDCEDSPQPATGGFLSFVTVTGSCPDCVTPVEESTWGRVKALYR